MKIIETEWTYNFFFQREKYDIFTKMKCKMILVYWHIIFICNEQLHVHLYYHSKAMQRCGFVLVLALYFCTLEKGGGVKIVSGK